MNEIILLIASLLTIFIMVLVPIYWKNYGPQNFLWLSDIGLFLTMIALWVHSSLLISVVVIAILPFEIVWNIDFFFRLLTGRNLLRIVNYMFDSKNPKLVRSLSLFHVILPILWIWCLFMWGYDKRALEYATILIWVTMVLTYFLTNPEKNINWVFFPKVHQWDWIPPFLWLIFFLIAFPLVIIWPVHMLLVRIF